MHKKKETRKILSYILERREEEITLREKMEEEEGERKERKENGREELKC